MKTVYMIRCDLEPKIYIGVTGNSIKSRFREHKKERKKKRSELKPLYMAMNRYGVEHFDIVELEKVDDCIAAERERYWIEKTRGDCGSYNIANGGKGRPLYNHFEILEKIRDCKYTQDVANDVGCSKDIVKIIARKNGVKMRNKRNDSISRKVRQFSMEREVLNEFSSLNEAARWCVENGICKMAGSVHTHIGECAKGERKTAYGYLWEEVKSNE